MSVQSTHKTPDLSDVFTKIRKAKDASGLTNQELADKSGIPYNSVCTITAGTAKQATLANVAAICAVLGLSLDEMAGLRDTDTSGYIRELEIENACMKKDVEYFKQDAEHFKKEAQAYRPLMFCLMGLCVLLLIFVIGYVIWDISQKHAGLFRVTGISAGAVIIAVVILISIIVLCSTLMWLIKSLKRPQD